MAYIALMFQNNKHATSLYGKFDENLAHIEAKMGVVLRSRGNELILEGEQIAIESAKTVIDTLYNMIKNGQPVGISDVDGAVRMAVTQPPVQTLLTKNQAFGAQISTKKRTIHARTPTQDAYMRALDRGEMVFGVGPAGTGKTYLAVAHAAMLLERGIVERIILSRPAVEAGEHLGFLPGDMKEKVDPYLRPLYDALHDMMPADKVDRSIASGVIEIAPLAFMRGRTLSHAVIILDEAQNTTSMQMKMFLTRLGENGRMIITGDPSQIDLSAGQKSGLVEALEILEDVPNVLKVRFTQKDVVRHPLVAEIVAAYDKRKK
jgi:phosphate starvation-inducible protein PhoH and related proteins